MLYQNMIKPKVSVIVPVYNVEKYLDRCVQSIRKQTLSDIEIILVDDGSPDKCPAMCDEYARQDSRIKVVHKQNAGLGMARNSGIECATGEYLMFVDSDDTISANACNQLYTACMIHNADISVGCFNRETTDGNWSPEFEHNELDVFEGENLHNYILDMIASPLPDFRERKHPVSVCVMCIRKNLIFDYSIKFKSEREVASEDLLFKIGTLKAANKLVALDFPFYNYYNNNSSLTTTFNYSAFEKLQTLREHLLNSLGEDTDEAKNRITRFIISDARMHIVRLIKSNENRKISMLKKILTNPIWHYNSSFPVNQLPLMKRLYFKLCKSQTVIAVYLFTLILAHRK